MSSPSDVREWVRLADEDFGFAMLAIWRRVYPGLACYHAQQTAEKCLKAILTAASQLFPRTHDLVTLYALCPGEGRAFALDQRELIALTPYATGVQYPGFLASPSIADARRAILMAGRVRRTSRRFLGLR